MRHRAPPSPKCFSDFGAFLFPTPTKKSDYWDQINPLKAKFARFQ